MGTRCLIELHTSDKKYHFYNQFDGYLSSIGKDCILIAKNSNAIKKALINLTIFPRSFKGYSDDEIREINQKIASNVLYYTEQGKNRWYDNAGAAILGLLDNTTNFLVVEDNLENARSWIDYHYIIDLDTQIVSESIHGYVFKPEFFDILTTPKFLDTFEESLYFYSHPDEISDETILSFDEIRLFLNSEQLQKVLELSNLSQPL